MQIQKRTMNWLPRPSLYEEAENARLKRKAYVQDDIAKTQALASGLIGGATDNVGEQINLTLRIAASRIQTQAQEKQKALMSSLDVSA
jgi:hypothetical protein